MPNAGKQFFGSLLRYARPKIGSSLALVVLGALLEGAGILLLLAGLQIILGQGEGNGTGLAAFLPDEASRGGGVAAVVVLFLGLMIVRAGVIVARDVRLQALASGYVNYCRNRLFAALAGASWQRVTAIPRSDVEHTLMTDIQRISQGATLSLRAGASFILLVTQITVALFVAPVLTLIIIAFFAMAGGLMLPFIRRSRRTGQRLTLTGRDTMRLLGNFLSGLKLARTHGAEKRYIDAYEQQLERWRSETLAFTRQQTLTAQVYQVMAAVAAGATAITGLVILKLPLASVTIVLLILARLTVPSLGIIRAGQSFANMLPAYENYEHLVRQAAPDGKPVVIAGHPDLPRPDGAAAIRLEGMSFQHERADLPLLRDISLNIAPGEFAVVTGPSGAGKTTLIDVICGLLSPASGQVLVDGELLTGAEATRWYQDISYVPQDPFLFDESIRDNLLWSANGAGDEEIWRALDQAGAAGFVRALPEGLDTHVGERGTQISGGERQRLCLARALLRHPRLLILDEATNALDAALEADILRAVHALRGKTTIIIVTHRLDPLPGTDRIFRIEKGRLEETTTI